MMIKHMLVLVVSVTLSSETCIAIEGGQGIDSGNDAKQVNPLQGEQNRGSEIGPVVGALDQALERALWEIETKRLALENERRRLDALIAKVETIDDSVKEAEKGFGDLIDQVSWGSSITTNILAIVLTITAVVFAGGLYGVYQGVNKMLRPSVKKEHKRLTSELNEHHTKLTQEAKLKVLTATYFQLTTAYYEQYRLLFGYERTRVI